MSFTKTKSLLGALMGVAVTGAVCASGPTVPIGDPTAGIQAADEISIDTLWTNDNVYDLRDQIFVTDGATLTIEPGTVIASSPSAGGTGGSLAVTAGSKIVAQGTRENPIIFTSSADVATWDADAGHPTGGDPNSGDWRVAANEWGNLTIMGNAYISNGPGQNHFIEDNTATCGDNISRMEGFALELEDEPFILYGGTDDDDDSGILEYVSIRYAGQVVGLGDELNGLSCGGLGRETTINHIEIMNNVDDGIETWGGTVNYKNFTIWNVGDDSFDFDQGWRGKAQFGLIVQGYSLVASQGSGVGDNCIEGDGAEDADAQPVSTCTMYNLTVVGQPLDGDHGVAYRDGLRAQIRQSIFMNVGDFLIYNEHFSDNGADGYGLDGTLGFPATWATAYDNVPAHANDCGAGIYTAQSAGDPACDQGFLNEMTDSVFWLNSATAYNDPVTGRPDPLGANSLGVTVANDDAPDKCNVVSDDMPIMAIARDPVIAVSGKNMVPVNSIDPRANNDALVSAATAPNDGFYTPVEYRGAFPCNTNWLEGWTAAHAYGMTVDAPCPEDTDCNGAVDVIDLLEVLGKWGGGGGLAADTNVDGVVDVLDLLAVLGKWGPCP